MLTPGGLLQSVRDQQQTLPTTQNLGLQAGSSAQTQKLPASAQRPVGTVVFQSATGHHAEQQLLESQSAGDVELSPSAASAAVERRRRSAQGQLLQSRGACQQQRPQRTLSLRRHRPQRRIRFRSVSALSFVTKRKLNAFVSLLQATAAAWIGTATEEVAPTRTTAPKLRRRLRR